MIAAGPALAQGGAARMAQAGAGLAGAPNAAVRSGVSSGVLPNRGVMPNVQRGVNPGVQRGVAPNEGVQRGIAPNNGVLPGAPRSGLGRRGLTVGELRGRRFGRFRRREGYGGLAAAGLGLAGSLAALPYDDAGYGGYDPDFVPAYAPPRCVQPQIISIGRGLRHKAHTRVVYGRPSACVP